MQLQLELSMLLEEHDLLWEDEWEVHDKQHDVDLFDDIMLDEDVDGDPIEVLLDWVLPEEQLES